MDATLLQKSLARVERRKRLFAVGLTTPLLVFLLFVFVLPIASLLMRSVENPEVADALPHTATALASWDRQSEVPAQAFAAMALDLSKIEEGAQTGALARRLNTAVPGARSLIMGTYRAQLHDPNVTPEVMRDKFLTHDPRWAELPYWQAIARNTDRWTPEYLLAAVDYQRDASGDVIAMPEDQAVFKSILLRTFWVSAIITFWCLLLGYPLAWWLASLPARKANFLMILILIPFWTSVLVRIAAWIVLLQQEGLVNSGLQALGLIGEPLNLLFNRTGVVISMTHILLPFMILPLYSVMKSIPTTYMRAAISLGSPPWSAFVRVYIPQTLPGVTAGALLVFIVALGYYVTPALVGGASDQMISYYVAQYTNVDVNWGMACALAAILLAATMTLYSVYRRLTKAELSLG